ncbi:DUF4123 domain-containing protein [Pseudomonas sp. GD03860]|uniref:DUF4123 domain-containing protein n=1 Tax=Pseudomonas TaxID=286 RepID=UPI0023641894|nr:MULTISPECIES: DUF4123 domain-containing protein [Pseudomonas]MDD2058074.1 DUF4123 domain-containing protein [Pseudomonas putida]MDH0640984.1 DUF4123 domain-containing protein [Pseudomonas sp. GD03860]
MIKSIASAFQTPAAPGVLCVIVDASFDPQLQLRIDQSLEQGVTRSVALFNDTPYVALQAVGPIALLCPTTGGLMDHLSTLFERTDAGCVAYMKNEYAFEQVVTHWRSLLTVSTDDGPTRMFRFFDPRWLEPLLNSLDEAERWQFLGPITDLAWRNELGWRHQANPRATLNTEVKDPGWLHLDRQRQNAMDHHRLQVQAAQLAQHYRSALPMPQAETFVYEQLLAARQAGYLEIVEQERWLRLALRHGDGFWERSPFAQLLQSEDQSLDQKLVGLEQL